MKISIEKTNTANNTLSYIKTRKIVDILEASKYFEKKVYAFRKKHNIPKEGYSIEIKNNLEKRSEILKTALPLFESYEVIDKFNFHLSWVGSIMDVFLYNTLSDLTHEGFTILPTSKIGSVEVHDLLADNYWMNSFKDFQAEMGTFHLEQAVLLAIRQRYTKTQLKQFIDDNWDEIEAGMQNMAEIKLHKVQRSKLSREITELRDSQDMTYSQIADTLAKKYEDDIELYDLLTEDYVKNLYSRWKKKMKKVSGT